MAGLISVLVGLLVAWVLVRVALARALAVEPRVLLLDEPFGALDAKVRKELRRWLRRLHDDLHIASVFVTHDQEEALEVSDRVAIMNHGLIEQVGTPAEVYDNPATAFVYQFIGDVNLFHARGYARPYELDVARHSAASRGAVVATVSYIAAAGPVGDRVDVTPRNLRVFAKELGAAGAGI